MRSNEVISHIDRDNKAGPKIAFMLSRYKSYLKRTDTTDSGDLDKILVFSKQTSMSAIHIVSSRRHNPLPEATLWSVNV